MTKTKTNAETAEIETRDIRKVAVADLTLSPMNPRQEVSDGEIDAMAESIRAAGLIQNLAGFETEAGIEIVAGGRRLRALQKIAAEQDVPPVPVMLAKDEAEAQAWASAENIQRADLHPADEVRAYAAMAETGASGDAIAKAFGVTFRHVAGRMKLAHLPDVILDALKADEITLDVAAAYTISEDPERILATYQALEGTYAASNDYTIRKRLMEGRTEGDDQMARFVGRARYEAEGGTITEDLFGEDVYFDDPDLLVKLAEAELAKAGEAVKAEGWSWLETDFDGLDWQQAQKFGRTYPQRADAAEGDAERYDELAEKVEYGEATDAEDAEFTELEARLDVETFTDEQMAHAGAFVSVNYSGKIEVQRGMVRPKDLPAAIEAGICAKPHRSATSTAPKGPYSAALESDLVKVRTCAVQTALLAKPELVLDLLTFALSQPIFGGALPVGVSSTDADNQPEKDDGLTVDERIEALPYNYPKDGKGAAKAFATFRAKPKKVRNAILTENVAKLVRVGLDGTQANPFAEMIAQLSGASIRSVWTPTSSFLSRLKGAQLDAIMVEISGQPGSATFGKGSKRDKVARLHALFNNTDDQQGLSAEAKARLAVWVPNGMEIADTKLETGGSKKAA